MINIYFFSNSYWEPPLGDKIKMFALIEVQQTILYLDFAIRSSPTISQSRERQHKKMKQRMRRQAASFIEGEAQVRWGLSYGLSMAYHSLA